VASTDDEPGAEAEATDLARLSVIQAVRSDGFAGVERYICETANGLAGRGHRVVVVGGDPTRMRHELCDEVLHHPASSISQVTRALLGHRGADVIHAHMTAAEGAAWLARPLQRAPVVATRHFPGGRGTGAPARLLARMTSRAICRDIAISQFVADGIDGPSVLIPNSVPDQAQATLESPTVVMLQRLTTEKDPAVGIRAWASSSLGSRGWRLVVAGVGDLRPSLIDLVHDLGVGSSVEFAGLVSDTDRLLDGSSMLLAPAPAEPFGLSVVEAMSHGVPVIAAGGGAHVETVGEDGILFDPGDAEAAANALAALAGDRARRLRIGGRLRDRQRRLFALPHHLDRLELLYREVIRESARRTR